MKFALPEEARRPAGVLRLFETVVHYCILYGEIYATADLQGVAGWLPPGQTTLTAGRILRSGMATVQFKLGAVATRRLMANTAYTNRLHKQVLPGPHWYLWAIGVAPACQGRGLGGKLLAPILEKASSTGMPCYLETHNPKNLAFYAKFGFEVVREGQLPKRELAVWALVRQP